MTWQEEHAKMHAEWKQVDKRSRNEMMTYAERWALPISECYTDAERAEMTTKEIRFQIAVIALDVVLDRLADAHNSAF